MTRTMTIAAAALLLWSAPLPAQPFPEGSNLGNVQGGDFTAARTVIAQRCTRCHTGERIDAALKAGKDLGAIQKTMERKGAALSANERRVLGIYWQRNPLKK
ncbi:MAG TPA: hypothetical protein VF795_04105 [Desulfuromonadaceae bacterium]